MTLSTAIQTIRPLDADTARAVQAHIDQLVKPQGSLGAIEAIAVQLAGIQRTPHPAIEKKAVVVMCADHGVCAEGVASAPQIVTLIQAQNIAAGVTGVGAFAKANGADVFVIDIGMDIDKTPEPLRSKSVRRGTGNISIEPAMSYDEAVRALEVGIEAAGRCKEAGYQVIATGEMGIGNTTPSTALLCALTGKTPAELTGPGANLPEAALPRKIHAIERALERYESVRTSCDLTNYDDTLFLLSQLGGLDIAGMAGTMIGGAALGMPVIIDGFISTVAALIACTLCPDVKAYLFPSHASSEKSAALASDQLGLKPYLNLQMRLGEGSGAVLMFPILEAACAMVSEMITFEAAGIGVV